MFYILHGDDDLARAEKVAEFKAKIGDPTMRDLNMTLFEGRKLTVAELRFACDAVPFLAEQRVVVVHGGLSQLTARRGKKDEGDGAATPKAALAELLDYLPTVPASTNLIFVEAAALPATHPVLKLALSIDKQTVIEFKLPAANQLIPWINKRIKQYGGAVDSAAAALLADFSGGDVRALDQEIQKLLAYVNWARAVTAEDVHLLVRDARQGDVFAMVDALAQGKAQIATRELHRLLDSGEAGLSLFGMIVRQFRLLIMLKELSLEHITGDEAAAQLKIHPFVARKLGAQAKLFELAQLEQVYHRLQEIDFAIKTGQVEDSVALDMLAAGLAV